MAQQEQWVTITDAAVRLGVGPSKISRLVKSRQIKTKDDPIDKRLKLVDFGELEKLFESSARRQD